MKVFVTYEKEGDGGTQVEKVFLDRKKAIKWVIDSRLSRLRNEIYDYQVISLAEDHIAEIHVETDAS